MVLRRKKAVLPGAGFLALWVPLAGGLAPVQDETRPVARNAVLILMDDVGHGDLGCQGSSQVSTPHIDRLATQGVRCTRAYVTAGTCSPSRAALLTGRYQQRFGHEFNPPHQFRKQAGLPASEVTLARKLGAAGFKTGAFGKWHLGYGPPSHPLSQGFDEFYGFLSGARSYRPYEAGQSNRMNQMLLGREPVAEEFGYLTTELGERAVDFITRHKEDRFFVFLSFSAVHSPLQPDPKLELTSPPGANEKRGATLNMLASLDLAIGRVLEALQHNGLADDTLVVLLSDNGGALKSGADNGGLVGGKGDLAEGGVRVPFLVRWTDGLPGGLVYDGNLSALDVFPTTLAALGVPEGDTGLDGVNLAPHFLGEREEPPHPYLYWRQGERWAVLAGDHKLISDGERTLYRDLARGGGAGVETGELASDGEAAARVRSMRARHAGWSAELRKPKWRKYTLETPADEDSEPDGAPDGGP